MWLFFSWTNKLHEYTRNIEISNTQIKFEKRKTKKKSGDNVDLTIKNVIF